MMDRMRLTRAEAQRYYEDDDDRDQVLDAFDTAEREGRLGQTAPHSERSWPEKLGVAAALTALGAILIKAGRKLQGVSAR